LGALDPSHHLRPPVVPTIWPTLLVSIYANRKGTRARTKSMSSSPNRAGQRSPVVVRNRGPTICRPISDDPPPKLTHERDQPGAACRAGTRHQVGVRAHRGQFAWLPLLAALISLLVGCRKESMVAASISVSSPAFSSGGAI